ncbi:hypothetical protein BaRGS_00004854 [Batillaria attramentaria]|uniref:Secreted protein n=1 Tax=Batillaria attramentaria TaxID=370345 RepID=A0ABD0LX99_9CAEN
MSSFTLLSCLVLTVWSVSASAVAAASGGADETRNKRSDDTSPLQVVVDTLSQQVTSLSAKFDALQNSVDARLATQQSACDAKVAALETKQSAALLENNRVAFRVASGSGVSAYNSYVTGSNCGCASNSYLSRDRYYRSSFLDSWPSCLIDTVRVTLIENGHEMAFVEFNGRGSTSTDWFSENRVLNTSWTDLRTQPHNFFSIAGDPGNNRRFFMEHSYGGCAADSGWLVVVEGDDGCTWGQGSALPIILYSKRSGAVLWEHTADVGRADEMVITVKLRDGVNLSQSCSP